MLQTFKYKIKSLGMAKKAALLLAIVLIAVMGVGSTFAYIVTGTPSLVNLFTNGLAPDGNLTIEKTLTHPYGKDYIVPQNLAFTFDVDLGEDYAGKILETTQGEMTCDQNGVLTLSISPSGRATVYDIDENTAVTVTETNLGKGFTIEQNAKDITIAKYKDNFLTFANTYTPEKAKTEGLSVSGTKSLEGRDWLAGDSFTFALEVYDADKQAWTVLAEDTVIYEISAEGTAVDPDFNQFDFTESIQDFAFDQVGTYFFRVKEMQGTIGGITYDKTEGYFDVIVGDGDMDGYLEIQSITSSSNNTKVENQIVEITFDNSYAPTGSAKVDLTIKKELQDLSGQGMMPAGYTFELHDEEDQLVDTSEATNVLGETSLMKIYTPEDAGKVFSYTLKETNCGKEENGLTYSDKVYRLQVQVIDNLDGTVSAIIYEAPEDGQTVEDAAKDATTVFEADFINIYDPTDNGVTITGKKKLSGRQMAAEEFTFALYEADKNFDVPKDSNPIDTSKNDADGNFAFDYLTYDKVGTYYYVVKEDYSAEICGIKYDKTRFFVTVKVTDIDGTLTVERTITNDDGAAAEIVFNNEYAANAVTYTLSGKKILNGAELKEKMFGFQLYAANEGYEQVGDVFATALNDADGNFSFKELTFSTAGTYHYLVKEDVSGAVDGMTYDKSVYQVAIEVKDDGTGQLQVGDVTMTANGQVVEEIKFINTVDEGTDQPGKPGSGEAGDSEEDFDGNNPQKPDEPDKPEQPDEPDDGRDKYPAPSPGSDEPDTGDHSSLSLYVVLIAAAVIAIAMMKRRNTTK